MLRPFLSIFLTYVIIFVVQRDACASFVFKGINLPPQFNGTVITDAAYDQAGMLWFSSNSGLHYYDGHQVISFNMNTSPAVNYTAISRIMADNRGSLWLGGKNGMVRFDLKRWTTEEIPFHDAAGLLRNNDKAIVRIFKSKSGQILAGAHSGKLFLVRNGKLEKIFDLRAHLGNSYPDCAINQIVEAQDGTIWLGTAAGFLVNIDVAGKRKPAYYGRPEFKKRNIYRVAYVSQSDEVIFNAQVGVYVLNCKTKAIRQLGPETPITRGATSFFHINDQTFLVTASENGATGRLTVFDYPLTKRVEKMDIPPTELLATACRGNQVLLTNGVMLYTLTQQNTGIEKFMYKEGAGSSIRSIFKEASGKLLVGSYRDKFVELTPETDATTKISQLQPYCIMPWNEDTVLIGEEGNGLLWYKWKSKHMAPIRLKPRDSARDYMSNTFVTCLRRESDSTVWMGTYHGVFLVNVRKRYFQNVLQGGLSAQLQHTKVSDVLMLGRRRVLATAEGLFYFNVDGPEVLPFCDSLLHHTFYNLQLVNNQVWAASGDMGLVVLDTAGHIVKTISQHDGLAGKTVFSLQRWKGYLIAGTEHGLSIIRLKDLEIHNYTTYDGLPSNECNTSALLITDTEVYAGTSNGLAMFNPDQLFKAKNDTLLLPLFISALKIDKPDGKEYVDYSFPYRSYDEIVIPAGTDFFSITIQTSHQATAGYERRYYRLSSLDTWHEITDRNGFSFVNMPPGTYQLELAARAADGRMLEGLFSKRLRVLPRFYQTWEFKLLMGALFTGLVILFTRVIIRYREQQLEKERMLRLQIAGDLHDEVGSMLTGMSLQADFLLQKRQEKQEEYLHSIANTGRSAISTMADIVWSIDPRNDDTLSLAAYLKRYAADMLTTVGVDFVFEQQGNRAPEYMSQKVRQNVTLIYKEALTNICKHAGATKVHIVLMSETKRMSIIIADNGKGLEDVYQPDFPKSGGHGLRNMKMRAAAIGGTLRFINTEKGLTLQLEVRY